MSYCLQEDVTNLISERDLIQLTDDADTGLVETDLVDAAIAAADARIDFYCSASYTTPFTDPPSIIKAWSIDIAIYDLYSRRSDVAMPEIRQKRYDAAIALLEKIQSGDLSIGGLPGIEDTDVGGPASTKSADDRIFTIGTSSVSGTLDNY